MSDEELMNVAEKYMEIKDIDNLEALSFVLGEKVDKDKNNSFRTISSSIWDEVVKKRDEIKKLGKDKGVAESDMGTGPSGASNTGGNTNKGEKTI